MRTLALAVALLAAVAAIGQDLPPVTPLTQPMIYDSTGKLMGQLVSVDDFSAAGTMLLALPGGDVVTLRLRRFPTGVRWANAFEVFYSLPGCTGDAYIIAIQSFSDIAAIVDRDENLLTADTTQPGTQFLYLSSLRPDGTCSNLPGGVQPAVRATFLTSLRSQFSAPFRVQNMHRIRIVSGN